ncbi:hypothetical protein P7K49_035055 [Saguinus oedipus]|uniref:Uncharacterized protein n=1 Tax=Saguinus oedipus TaxID=9490 RepID=A0ABQ9TWG4_SAGOE|nr:hypothetical protein P7K49_035055 [Saguinus oedipus]
MAPSDVDFRNRPLLLGSSNREAVILALLINPGNYRWGITSMKCEGSQMERLKTYDTSLEIEKLLEEVKVKNPKLTIDRDASGEAAPGDFIPMQNSNR